MDRRKKNSTSRRGDIALKFALFVSGYICWVEQNCADCLDVVGVASCGYYILWLGKLTDLRFNLGIVVQVIPNPFCRLCCGPVGVSIAQECHPGGCCGFGGWGFWFGVTTILSKIKKVAGSIILMEIHLKN